MKIFRFLGILWFALCSFLIISLLGQLGHIFFIPDFKFKLTPVLFFAIVACLIYLFGAIASVFLFLGTSWARISVGIFALLNVIACIVQIVVFRSFPIWTGVIGLFALASAPLLLFPRLHISAKSRL